MTLRERIVELVGELERERDEAREQLDLAREQVRVLREALIQYIEWEGLEHETDCPADDTCSCVRVQAIDQALQQTEPKS